MNASGRPGSVQPGGAGLPEAAPETFRNAMARFATGVTVVTVSGVHPHAMTANAVASVSLDPPLLLVCVEQEARLHDALLADGRFGVTVLAADQARISDWLATRGRPLVGQLSQVPTRTGPVLGVPLVTGGLVQLECEVRSVHEEGDHSIVVGLVRGVTVAQEHRDPLLWFASGYRGLSPA